MPRYTCGQTCACGPDPCLRAEAIAERVAEYGRDDADDRELIVHDTEADPYGWWSNREVDRYERTVLGL